VLSWRVHPLFPDLPAVKKRPCATGDLLVLLRPPHEDQAAGHRIADGNLLAARLGLSASLTPIQGRPSQIAARTSGSFSPMPPMKTIRSTPSSAAIMAAICPYQVAEHLDSKPRVGVRQSGLM
jgi:hypothetical protein